jgi:hypothetical protein
MEEPTMTIRTYQPRDEVAQVAVYNEAAAKLPKFKPATVEETRRRCLALDFDPDTRFYAEEAGQVVGYMTFYANGRVSYPWCRPGHEAQAEPLFEHVLAAMRARGMSTAFAAYRADWPEPLRFFEACGFTRRREMLNFLLDLIDLPTPAAPLRKATRPLRREDVPAVLATGAGIVRARTAPELERHLFENPYFPAESAFVLPGAGPTPAAVAVLVDNPAYADPTQIDSAMPCFRLGAFGTEGMQTKRIHGVFSFLAADDRQLIPRGLDLLGHSAFRLDRSETSIVAAQVPSDATHLVGFYERFFRKQGSFPILERAL